MFSMLFWRQFQIFVFLRFGRLLHCRREYLNSGSPRPQEFVLRNLTCLRNKWYTLGGIGYIDNDHAQKPLRQDSRKSRICLTFIISASQVTNDALPELYVLMHHVEQNALHQESLPMSVRCQSTSMYRLMRLITGLNLLIRGTLALDTWPWWRESHFLYMEAVDS